MRRSPVLFVMVAIFLIVTNRVRPDAFLPHKRSIDISVFRISELTEDEVWKIGQKYVHTEERPVKARADFSAAVAYENNLEVVPDEPPQRHANIGSFPVDNGPTNRKARRSLAAKLATLSKLIIPPEET